jgi:Phage gp6-like head-tail connector protein
MHSVFEIIDESTDSAGPDLVSLDDLKFALGITDSSEDAQLQAAITFQSRIIAEYCDRRFGRAEALETFRFDLNEIMPTRQALTLSLYPVVEVIELAGTTDGYDFDPVTGRLWTQGNFADVVSVTYSGGYDLPEEAPARLAKAVIEAVFEARAMGSRDPSIRSIAHGDTNISYFTSATATANAGFLSAPVIDLIRPYRRPHVA